MIATLDEIKELLQIPASTETYDGLIKSLIPTVQEWLLEHLNNYFMVAEEDVYLISTAIVFNNASPPTIANSDDEFVDAGFVDDMHLRFQGSLYNDGIYEIETVAAGTLTLATAETLMDEDKEQEITINVVKFKKGLKHVFSALIGEDLKNSFTAGENVISESVGNTNFSFGGSKIKGSYPPELLAKLSPFKRVVKV